VEERRIFYVAVSRAMNELTLTYPSTVTRGGYGPTVFTSPSRFLSELDTDLYERAELEHKLDVLDDESHLFGGPSRRRHRSRRPRW
jgi:DNA helicase-2/ATP-dependent DNA helicase PcrA